MADTPTTTSSHFQPDGRPVDVQLGELRVKIDAVDQQLLSLLNQRAQLAQAVGEVKKLDGSPVFNPDRLTRLSHAEYDESEGLKDMIRVNLVAERVAVEFYRQAIALVGDKDPTTRQMLETILRDEEEHADELADLLAS